METRRKPTRKDLLIVIGRLQDLVGNCKSRNHDRNQNRQAQVDALLDKASKLCILARSQDPPNFGPDRGPWASREKEDEIVEDFA